MKKILILFLIINIKVDTNFINKIYSDELHYDPSKILLYLDRTNGVKNIADIDIINNLAKGVYAWNKWIRKNRNKILKRIQPFDGSWLDRRILNGINFSRIKFSTARFYYSKIRSSNFSYSSIADASFLNADVRNSNFYNAEIVYTNFSYANLKNVTFNTKLLSECYFVRANLENADFSKTVFSPGISAIYNRNYFEGANLKGANFSNKSFHLVPGRYTFKLCNLEKTNFRNADLTRADFRSAYLKGANFYYSNLENAVIEKKWKPYLLRFKRTIKNWNKIKWVENGEPFNPTLNPYLIRAIKAGDYNKCKKLIKLGADVNAIVNGVPALTWACYKGQVKIAELLVRKGAELNIIDKDGDTMLHAAVFKNRVKTVKFLMTLMGKIAFKINHRNFNNRTALDVAVEKGYTKIINILKNYGIERYYTKQFVLNKSLLTACKNGNLAQVKQLIKKGADINVKDNYGITALMYASSKGYLNIVKYLVTTGANINFRNYKGYTALGYAIFSKKYVVARYLRSVGGRE